MPENKQTASITEEGKNTVKHSAFLTGGHWGSLHLKRRFSPKKRQSWHHLLSLMLLHSQMTCFYRTEMEKSLRIVLILKSWISMQLQRMKNWSCQCQASKGTQNMIQLNHDSCATFQAFWSHKRTSEKLNKIHKRFYERSRLSDVVFFNYLVTLTKYFWMINSQIRWIFGSTQLQQEISREEKIISE